MSIKFLISYFFIAILFIGGFMTGNGYGVLEIVMMLSGFFGTIGTLVLLNKPKWNKKLWNK